MNVDMPQPGELALRPWRRALYTLRPIQILLCFAGFIMTAVALAGFGKFIKTTDVMIGSLRTQQPLPPEVYFFDSHGELHPNLQDLEQYRTVLQTGTKMSCANFTADVVMDFITATILFAMFVVTCVFRATPGIIAAHALLCFSYVVTACISAKLRRKHIEFAGWSGSNGVHESGKSGLNGAGFGSGAI
eukprot:gene7826-8023_t